jgi:hypothetical protein
MIFELCRLGGRLPCCKKYGLTLKSDVFCENDEYDALTLKRHDRTTATEVAPGAGEEIER